ncbi:uncharacterized protein BDV17DRAFT_278157 [Aspergillus undulatus]|uniref:uncharacterized protein n=1 Tax=Aspergillus undulatus TaxID=1810928 RepID=UPI003CCCC84B
MQTKAESHRHLILNMYYSVVICKVVYAKHQSSACQGTAPCSQNKSPSSLNCGYSASLRLSGFKLALFSPEPSNHHPATVSQSRSPS